MQRTMPEGTLNDEAAEIEQLQSMTKRWSRLKLEEENKKVSAGRDSSHASIHKALAKSPSYENILDYIAQHIQPCCTKKFADSEKVVTDEDTADDDQIFKFEEGEKINVEMQEQAGRLNLKP